MNNEDEILDKVIKNYEEGIKALEDRILNIKETIESRKKDLAEYYKMKEKRND